MHLSNQSIQFTGAVLPKLEYCITVWDPHQSTLTKKLENTQSFACKIITKERKSDYNYFYIIILNKLQFKLLVKTAGQIPFFADCIILPCAMCASLCTKKPVRKKINVQTSSFCVFSSVKKIV